MARGCGSCGQRPRRNAREPVTSSTYVDPTRAVFAAATPRYEVRTKTGTVRVFTSLASAQDYAKSSGGTVRVL